MSKPRVNFIHHLVNNHAQMGNRFFQIVKSYLNICLGMLIFWVKRTGLRLNQYEDQCKNYRLFRLAVSMFFPISLCHFSKIQTLHKHHLQKLHPDQTNHIPSNESPGFLKWLFKSYNSAKSSSFIKLPENAYRRCSLASLKVMTSRLFWHPSLEVFIFVSATFLRRWQTVLRRKNTLPRRRSLTYCGFVRSMLFQDYGFSRKQCQ